MNERSSKNRFFNKNQDSHSFRGKLFYYGDENRFYVNTITKPVNTVTLSVTELTCFGADNFNIFSKIKVLDYPLLSLKLHFCHNAPIQNKVLFHFYFYTFNIFFHSVTEADVNSLATGTS